MSRPLRDPREPDPSPADDRLARAARQEFAFRSLIELGQELTVALDVYGTADLLLYNLMGQLGTSRSALWLIPDTKDAEAVLVRAHGFHRAVIEAIGTACARPLAERFATSDEPELAWALRETIGAAPFELVRHAEVAIFVPLRAREELLGWLALGPRIDGTAYDEVSLDVLAASLGMVGMSLQNALLYNRAQETNRRLRTMNESLNELDRLKTEFLNNVNHELRTPIAIVFASLECTVDDERIDRRTRDLLKGSLDQTSKLQALVENLLRFSEVRNDRIALAIMADDAVAALRSVVDDRVPGVTAGLRELVLRVAVALPPARFDRARLLEILNELIDNAVKFTPAGSRIELVADRTTVDDLPWLSIEVRDNGPGIAPERLGAVFGSFEQGDGSMTRTVGGLGVGLACAREVARRMGGRLTVESGIGSGTSLRLLLPVA